MKEIILKFTSALIGISVFAMLLSPVLAEEWDFNRWGYAFDNGGTPLDTKFIYAWIDGVSYEEDITGTGSEVGLFSLECPGDSPPGNNIKNGGYEGDTIFYTHRELMMDGIFFAETDIWWAYGFNIMPANLTEVANSPDLLKISKISIAPTPYIGIYDASGTATITDYALDINNGGAVQIAAGDVMAMIGQITYINPASFGGISNDSALTISEFSTGFIVDRVEYGTIMVEPQETIMTNAPNPAPGQEIHRTPTDGSDWNDCMIDFTTGPVTWPAVDIATATGIVNSPGWTNVAVTTITYTFSGLPSRVDLYFTTDGGTSWGPPMNDSTPDGTYNFICPFDGEYAYWAVAVGGLDLPPVSGDPPEHGGTYNYDGTAPSVDAGPDHLFPPVSAKFFQDAVVDASISGVNTYLWVQISGPGIVFFTPNPYIEDPMVRTFVAGVYTCQLLVTDNAGNTNSDTFSFEWVVFTNYTIPLLEGWNLISLPLEQQDESIDQVLNSIAGKWDCILKYDPLSPEPWKANNTHRPNQLNDFSTLNHKQGFWINITEPNVNLTVSGYIPTSTSIPLYAGWNLVGYPTLTEMTVADALWGTGADKVEVFDPAEPYRIKEVGPTYVMRPGEGYWVHVQADTTWIIDW